MQSNHPLKICLITAELTPLAKTGGLADVSAALAAQLMRNGHDLRVIMPLHTLIERNAEVNASIEPVPELQGLSVNLGRRCIQFSIDRVVLADTGLPVHLIRCPELYDRESLYTTDADEPVRYALLSLAALEMCKKQAFAADIFHCNDWHTGLLPLYLQNLNNEEPLLRRSRSVMTIHNIGYQGVFSADVLQDLDLDGSRAQLDASDLGEGRINYLKTGISHVDAITTVSPTYAREIQTPEFGYGLDGILRERQHVLTGILNGVDYHEWNPAIDSRITHNFSPADLSGKTRCKRELLQRFDLDGDSERPLIGIVSRLAAQKGIDLMERVLPAMLVQRDFSLAVIGSGESRYETFFTSLSEKMPRRVGFYQGYDEDLAHWIEAGSDMFLMPSAYEPCGLNQMYSLKYGTVPIVRQTGGLADSVQPINPATRSGTGVVFEHYDDTGLGWAIGTALDYFSDATLWNQVIQNGMAMDFSWERQCAQYELLFRQLAAA